MLVECAQWSQQTVMVRSLLGNASTASTQISTRVNSSVSCEFMPHNHTDSSADSAILFIDEPESFIKKNIHA